MSENEPFHSWLASSGSRTDIAGLPLALPVNVSDVTDKLRMYQTASCTPPAPPTLLVQRWGDQMLCYYVCKAWEGAPGPGWPNASDRSSSLEQSGQWMFCPDIAMHSRWEEAERRMHSALLSIQERLEADLTPTTTLVQRVTEFTEELFPGSVKIEVQEDPEIHDEAYFVLKVHASGDIPEIAERQRQWHRSLLRVASDRAHAFRISIDVE